jgi:hypothetical protein
MRKEAWAAVPACGWRCAQDGGSTSARRKTPVIAARMARCVELGEWEKHHVSCPSFDQLRAEYAQREYLKNRFNGAVLHIEIAAFHGFGSISM